MSVGLSVDLSVDPYMMHAQIWVDVEGWWGLEGVWRPHTFDCQTCSPDFCFPVLPYAYVKRMPHVSTFSYRKALFCSPFTRHDKVQCGLPRFRSVVCSRNQCWWRPARSWRAAACFDATRVSLTTWRSPLVLKAPTWCPPTSSTSRIPSSDTRGNQSSLHQEIRPRRRPKTIGAPSPATAKVTIWNKERLVFFLICGWLGRMMIYFDQFWLGAFETSFWDKLFFCENFCEIFAKSLRKLWHFL